MGLPTRSLLLSQLNRMCHPKTLFERGYESISEQKREANELIDSKQTCRETRPKHRHFATASLMTAKEYQHPSSMHYWQEESVFIEIAMSY